VRARACHGAGESPEDLLAEQQPQWQVETGTPCLDGEACPPGSEVDDEPPIEVQWAPASEIDAAIVRELLGQEKGGAEPEGSIASGGTTVVKRYVLGGRVVAMRRGGELFFLSADHLGSGSVILDDQGRWLADQRFFPYGETKRLDGASESYPTDRLFTGMGFHSYINVARAHARGKSS
jgi:hypothetical protein